MRSRRPQSLKEALNDWIRSSGLQGPLAKGRVLAEWESMLSPQMQQHVGKAWVRGDKLFVTVHSTVWRQELHMRREEWRRMLNEKLGSELIRELVFR